MEDEGGGEQVAEEAGQRGLAAGRAAADADDDGAWFVHCDDMSYSMISWCLDGLSQEPSSGVRRVRLR